MNENLHPLFPPVHLVFILGPEDQRAKGPPDTRGPGLETTPAQAAQRREGWSQELYALPRVPCEQILPVN